MSYILDALKKSQKDRELGRVPILTSSLHLSAERPTKTSPWTIAAVALAAMAVLIALYAAIGPRLGTSVSPAPPVSQTTPQDKAKAPATEPPMAEHPGPAAQPGPAPRPRSTAGEPLVRGTLARSPEVEEQAPILDEAALREQVERFEAQQHEPRPTTSAFAPGSGKGPTIPPDLRRDILDFKRQALRETGKKERPAPKQASAPDPKERVVVPPPPAAATAPPPAQPEVSTPPGGNNTATASPSAVRSGAVQPPRDAEGGGKPPQARVTVHVYAEEPSKRFVIINSMRAREGDRTDEGLVVEEIRPDGVVLSFQGQRFFRAR